MLQTFAIRFWPLTTRPAGRTGRRDWQRSGLLAVLAACSFLASCAGTIVGLPHASAARDRDALLVVPGFGYSSAGEDALRSLAPSMAADGIDLFVPKFISRSGLDASRRNLQRFIIEHQIDQYHRVHVFAFLAGAWTLNPLVAAGALPHLATVVYDRSPYQERAPRIADDHLHFLTLLRYGSPVFDLAKTPYPPLVTSAARVALVIETIPTKFIRAHEQAARSYGPFRFDCDAFGQPYDDCQYVAMSHDEIYTHFAAIWPEVRTFIRGGHFTETANRATPQADALGSYGEARR